MPLTTLSFNYVVYMETKEFPKYDPWQSFRRSVKGGEWEVLMGESWEPVYYEEDNQKLNSLYEKYLGSKALYGDAPGS